VHRQVRSLKRRQVATTTPQNNEVTYTYDGDGRGLCIPERSERGNMVKSVIGEVTTYYVGSYYEKKVRGSEQNERKTYFAGTIRIAMRENGTLTWLIADHLSSTSLTVDASGNLLSSLKYTAFGELRSGTAATDYLYTGQRQEAEIGLYFYVSRFFDPSLGRFVSPDSIVPGAGNTQAYDRYAYANNSPIIYIDPTGHIACIDGEQCGVKLTAAAVLIRFGVRLVGNFESRLMNAIVSGVVDVGIRMGANTNSTATEAFKATYGTTTTDPLVILWGTSGVDGLSDTCSGIGKGGCTSNSHLINFNGAQWSDNIMFRNNVVHELGHAFASRWTKWDPVTDTTIYPKGSPYNGGVPWLLQNRDTFANGPGIQGDATYDYMWNQRMDNNLGNEYFADLFLGWTYNSYGGGADHTSLDVFTVAMTDWISNPGQ